MKFRTRFEELKIKNRNIRDGEDEKNNVSEEEENITEALSSRQSTSISQKNIYQIFRNIVFYKKID